MSTTTEVPTGNTFDKYGSQNPVVKRLMTGFHSTLDELWAKAAPGSVLDVGCGEGVLTAQWAERLGEGRFVVYDLAGVILWAGLWAGIGYAFSDAIEEVALRVSALGRAAGLGSIGPPTPTPAIRTGVFGRTFWAFSKTIPNSVPPPRA